MSCYHCRNSVPPTSVLFCPLALQPMQQLLTSLRALNVSSAERLGLSRRWICLFICCIIRRKMTFAHAKDSSEYIGWKGSSLIIPVSIQQSTITVSNRWTARLAAVDIINSLVRYRYLTVKFFCMPLEIPNLSKITANLLQEHVKNNTIENHQITLNTVEYNTQFFIYCIVALQS